MVLLHLQLAYTVMQKSLEHEWSFVQSVTPRAGVEFTLISDALQRYFLPLMLQAGAHILGRYVTQLRVKQAGLSLTDPTLSDAENWMVSCIVTRHLVATLWYQTA